MVILAALPQTGVRTGDQGTRMSDVVITGPFTRTENDVAEHGVAPRDWREASETMLDDALASFDRLVQALEGACAA